MWSKRVRILSVLCALVLLLGTLSGFAYPSSGGVQLRVRTDGYVHYGYINGRGDGTFGPDDPVSRAEAAHMLCNLLEEIPSERVYFRDVPVDAWYADSVGVLAAAGVLDAQGLDLHPLEPLTRGEFVAMVVRLFPAGTPSNDGFYFYDVSPFHPLCGEIAAACSYGWVSGFPDGTFRPSDTLTRAAAVTVINNALGRTPDDSFLSVLSVSPFRDVSRRHWAFAQIVEASVDHTLVPDQPSEKWDWMDTEWIQRRPGGFYFEGADLYYIDPSTGFPDADSTHNGLYFGPDGKYTSGDAELDAYVTAALESVITDDMTQEEKLHAAYKYARDSFRYLRRNYYEMGDVSWGIQEAKTMFSTKRGNCYCYSAVFCYMARQLGYNAQLISGKVNNSNPVPHAWVEIAFDGEYFMYDPELEMSYRVKGVYSYNFYHMAYDEVPWRYYR